jgi:mannose-6-phosphate isomerase-like protein (cupin superfamily)
VTKPIINLADVPLRDGGNGKQFIAKLGRIGAMIGSKKLGCQLHIVPAGQKAFPRHAHHVNEEMFFVLAGEGTYRVGEKTYPIREGDVISAPPGDAETAHQIVNTGSTELRCSTRTSSNIPIPTNSPSPRWSLPTRASSRRSSSTSAVAKPRSTISTAKPEPERKSKCSKSRTSASKSTASPSSKGSTSP